MSYLTVELKNHHKKDRFNSSNTSLNNFLKLQAKKESKQGLSKVYVLQDSSDLIIAYYTLSASELPKEAIPDKLLKKIPDSYHGYPAILIGRLAVDEAYHGKGIGGEILVDAIKRCLDFSEKIGTSVILVDPIDKQAASFYSKFMFKSLPDSNRMLLKIDGVLRGHFNMI